MKKIVHIMRDTVFTEEYITFINQNFDSTRHEFLITNKGTPSEIAQFGNVFFYKKMNLQVLRKMYASQKNILHGLFTLRETVLYGLNPLLYKKAYWVIWGADLYQFTQRTNKEKLKRKVAYRIIDHVKRNIAHYVALVPSDFDLAKQYYGNTKVKYFEGMYANPVTLDFLDSIPKKRDEVVNIQLGNSASANNQHIEALDYLAKYKTENIKIFAPLSYSGEPAYIEKVVEHGKALFGDKFEPLLDFMNPQEYAAFLGKIDIALFNNDRQQALGNIFALAYLGKKLYLREGTSMWEQLTHYEQYQLTPVQSIAQQSFAQFIAFSDEDAQRNHLESKKRFDPEYMKQVWTTVFES